MEIQELRSEIDKIDQQIVSLFEARMHLCGQIAEVKKAHGLPTYVPQREQEKLQAVAAQASPELEQDVRRLYELLFELSRNYQDARR